MSSSILDDTKKALGLAPDYPPFDPELIMHINSVIGDLHQLGVGPDTGFLISGNTETWTDYIQDEPRLNNVKSYLFLRVKMLFDSPNVGYVLTSMEKMIEKAEWRISMAREEIAYPPELVEEDAEDGGGVTDPSPTEDTVIDGGAA